MESVPLADAHGHSNPVRGLGASKIASKFKASGGWFQALVALSPWHYAIDFNGFDSYVEAIDIHLRECKAAEEAGLRVACIAGFHPADVDKLIDRYKMDPLKVLELGESVIEYVGKLCREGVLDGIGEVGRQHYKTSPERVLIAEYILEKAVELAADADCVVHMHLENSGLATVELTHRVLSSIKLGEKRRKVLFHHSKPVMVQRAWELGYSSTLPGLLRVLEYSFQQLEPVYMIESDYIDDPGRPGAVIYPWEIADNIARLRAKGLVDEEYLYRVNVDLVSRIYGVEPP
ncbi:MAG: TatD family hydrolase [Desulfurococcales archaeon]|nr:TatD family hydrolase [Desulfurococcales archaeon]